MSRVFSGSKEIEAKGQTGWGDVYKRQEEDRVNINTASASELDALPGIGPVLAQRIIDRRTEQGPFTSVEELLEVDGIGQATLDGLREFITVKETKE